MKLYFAAQLLTPHYENRIVQRHPPSGVTYDSAGNVTADGLGNTFTYDAENRLVALGGQYNSATYQYDALSHRIYRDINGSSTPYNYFYDLSGHAIDSIYGGTTGGSAAWEIVYSGAAPLANYTNSTTEFYHSDQVGTIRATSGPTGAMYGECFNYPFGDGQSCTQSLPPLYFTGKEFDSESNLTHFLARKYSATQGRWTTADPAGMAATDPTNSQTWNRYAYVTNSPVTLFDPFGLDDEGNDDGSGVESGQGDNPSQGYLSQNPAPGDCSTPLSLNYCAPPLSPPPPPPTNPFALSPPISDVDPEVWAIGGVSAVAGWAPATYSFWFGSNFSMPDDVMAGSMAQQVFQGNRSLWNSSAIVGNAAGAATLAISGAGIAGMALDLAAGSSPAITDPLIANSEKVLAQTDSYHNFGELIGRQAMNYGDLAVRNGWYAQWIPGAVNGVSGVFQYGGWLSPIGNILYVTHTLFLP